MSPRRRGIGLKSDAEADAKPAPAAGSPSGRRKSRLGRFNSILVPIIGWSLVALIVPLGIWFALTDTLSGLVARGQTEKLLCTQIQDVRASVRSQLSAKATLLDIAAVSRVLAKPTNQVSADARWALNVGPLSAPKAFTGFGPPDGPVMQRLRNVPQNVPEGQRYLDEFVDNGRSFVACSEIYESDLPGIRTGRKGIYVVAWPTPQFTNLNNWLKGSASPLRAFNVIILSFVALVAVTVAAVLVTFFYGFTRELQADFEAVHRGRADRLDADRYPIELQKAVTLFNEIIEDNETALKNTRRLVAHVAHDVNNKLQAFTTGINAPELDRKTLLLHVSGIKSQIDRYRQLAVSSHAESQVRRQSFDLVDFAQEMLELQGFDATNWHVLYRLIVDGRVLQRIVGTKRDGDPEADGTRPRIIVRAHPGDLEIMLNNLLSNASRYGGGQVDLTLGTSGRYAIIDVDDDGLGIPEADRTRVFEAGVMLNPDQRLPGTGYGLDIVKAMATNGQGDVMILDAPLGGARFRLTLPILDEEEADRSGKA